MAEMNTRVKLSELVDAFEWASATGPFENLAYVDRASGRVWLVSDLDDAIEDSEDPPEDLQDESLYLPVPNKNELDLGRNLAFRFVQEKLPESYQLVRGFFSRPGAYGRFKNLLDDGGLLNDWYAYEKAGIEEALREWATYNDVELIIDPDVAS